MNQVKWSEWQPGLNNDLLTLKEIYETLPGAESSEISYHVKIFENPASPFAFKGAIDLEDHDCIHILLGRGLLNQDEAFVIGFTMGTNDLPKWQYIMFKWITQYFYKKPYKFNKKDVISYSLGVAYGQELRRKGTCKNIQEIKLNSEKYFSMTIREIRKELGIKTEKLRSIYRTEKIKIPDTKASKRLPINKDITILNIN